jgi:four helix bundle protein
MRRAAASIPANLAEGCGRRSDKEMARFVQIAMGSGAELSYHTLLARDLNFLDAKTHERLEADLAVIMRMMSSLSQKLKQTMRSQKLLSQQ